MIVLVGPTGVGKTKLSIDLAKHYSTDIISGDSVQVYQGLDIGSAKITKSEMDGVKHHMIDVLKPTEAFSVAVFQKMVRALINEQIASSKIPFIVGGTGLYIKGVLYDYNFTDSLRDEELLKQYNNYSNIELHKVLSERDFEQSLKIHPNNRKRVLQAISRANTNQMSDNNNKDQKMYDFLIIGLTMNRELLYERINKRVDLMIKNGLVEEVKGLYDKGINNYSVSAIGYKELYEYFNNEISYEGAIAKIKKNTRNFAKRQLTFFNNQFNINWIDVEGKTEVEIFNEATNLINEYLGE
ncbi:tRNA (adenosine(37)-N6)-dimethylallyltransferase MiaA [Candidatus Izimaplasma bacterium ZiA1]|uniref:tRNA (adenosine(37)-N6)-dimethylallyltransferase MiaA n=1 Tax=Candidatus Izimoplasma sp. ZiA1 TaxID=2024899 RepID=UPI000BAA659B|nr:tRNA (adenosine(37)-N6)-dimethylallyltransferase MiaA [Candidatus Izimaplasma bacterium ZiA1]